MTEHQIPYWFLYLCFGGMIFALGLFAKVSMDKFFSKTYGGEERRKVVTFTLDEDKIVEGIRALETHAKATQTAADSLRELTKEIREHTDKEAKMWSKIDDIHEKVIG